MYPSTSSKKLSSKSNLIFPDVFYHFTVFTTINCLNFIFNPSQSSVHFSNIFLFSSVESKTKYLLLFFFFYIFYKKNNFCFIFFFFFFNLSIYSTNDQMQRIYTVNIFIIANFLNCNVSNVITINVFARLFVNS